MLHANILDADELWNLTDPKLQMPHPKDPESPEIQTLSALLSRQSLGQDDACRGEPRLRLSVWHYITLHYTHTCTSTRRVVSLATCEHHLAL